MGGGGYFLTGEKLNGYLDRMRMNLHALDESIENVRKSPKGEKPVDKRARLKLLRDMVELQNQTLVAVKTHLLGRDETGAPVEPPDKYDHNAQIEFERYFNNQLSPWTQDDLKLECDECGVKSEDVSNRRFPHNFPEADEYYDLCGKCYDKRSTEPNRESKNADDIAEPASKSDITAIVQTAALLIKTLGTLPMDQRIAKLEELLANKSEVDPGMEPAYEAYRDVLQKELDKCKRG